jgi:hypothetical protein
MPYVSKWVRERALWMTLVEAVTQIQDCEGCTQLEAVGQLRQALGEADIPARWAAYPPINRPPSYSFAMPHLLSSEQVPTDAFFWASAPIYLDGNGRVIDEYFLRGPDGESVVGPTPRGRELFLLRSRVLELWPLSNHRRKESSPTGSGSTTQPELPVRRPASEADLLRAARELYQQPGKPPNLREAEEQLMSKFPSTSREQFIRPILRRQEFADLRLKRGNQPKR